MIRSIFHIRHVAVITTLLATVVLSAALVPTPVSAQDQPENRAVEVVGTGRIVNNNISTARKTAISDALVSAVGLVATDLLHPLVVVESFDEINRLLLTDAGSFVQYKILTETTSGKIYRVIVEASVSVDRIRDLFARNGILVQSETRLKALLLIAEKQLDDTTYRCWWADPFTESMAESGLAGALGSQGFEVLDHGQFLPGTLEAYMSETESLHDWEITDAQAAFFGAWYQADVVVVGTAMAEIAPNTLGDDLRSFRGSLSVRAIRTDSGEVLAESTRDVLTADVDDTAGSHNALAEAGTRAGALLAGQIQNAWQQFEETGPIRVSIVVKGGYQLAHFVRFRKMLAELSGVSNLQTSGMTPEATVLELEYEDTTQKMAEALLLKSFDGFGINITEASPDALRLSLMPN
jgi:hypothetical protein